MGGVISWYAATAYPLVFGGVGVFSPAFWTSPIFETYAKGLPTGDAATVYFFYAGGMESERMVADAESMAAFTQVTTTTQVQVVVDKQGSHNEEAWAKHFHDFLRFMLQHLPNQNSSIKK
jgi:predicted alpha/beta superfamily hydrolase